MCARASFVGSEEQEELQHLAEERPFPQINPTHGGAGREAGCILLLGTRQPHLPALSKMALAAEENSKHNGKQQPGSVTTGGGGPAQAGRGPGAGRGLPAA